MNKESKKESIWRNNAIQTIIASLLCIVIGLFVGYIVLLIINPEGASDAIIAILKNYFYYPSEIAVLKYCGTTMVKTSALLMCSLSVLFAYKVGFVQHWCSRSVCCWSGRFLVFCIEIGNALVCMSFGGYRNFSTCWWIIWCIKSIF